MRMQTNRFTPCPFRSPLGSPRVALLARRCRFHSIETGDIEEPAVRRVSDTPTVVPAVAYGVDAHNVTDTEALPDQANTESNEEPPIRNLHRQVGKESSDHDQDDQDNIQHWRDALVPS